MPTLRTLTFTPAPGVEREATTFTSVTDFDNAGLFHTFNRSQRPAYRFKLRLGPLTRQEVESLSALHAYHQGGRSFLWDGGQYGRVENFSLVGEGDGARRQYFLPNRYIGASSLEVRTLRPSTGATSAWATTAYSLNATPGILVFHAGASTTPTSGDDVQARWANQYRVLFEPDGIRVSEMARNLFTVELALRETMFTG